jgi:hypothetical protein
VILSSFPLILSTQNVEVLEHYSLFPLSLPTAAFSHWHAFANILSDQAVVIIPGFKGVEQEVSSLV